MTVIPDSPSLVLRSTHVLLIRIASSQIQPWDAAPDGLKRRSVHLDVVLEETVKGSTRQQSGEHVAVTVPQFQRPMGFGIVSVPGIWTDKPVEPGTRLLVFASSAGDDLAALLVEPQCRDIVPAEEALAGVRLAMRAETEPLRIPELLNQAIASAASLDYIFIEYLSTKFAQPVVAQPDTFALLLRLLETPPLPDVPRSALLRMMFDELMASKIFSDKNFNAFAIAMFHLLGSREAAALHENIASMYLPNLLGLSGGVFPRTADYVFREHPEERERARQILHTYRDGAAVDKLRGWLG